MASRERIVQFVEHKGISKNKFYKETGLSNGFLDKNNHPGADKLEQIIYIYPEINPEWLLTGKGEMLKSDTAPIKSETLNRKLIPFYDIEVEGSVMPLSEMGVSEHPDEWIDAGDWFRDADSAMRVHGDSMFPVYKSGSIVVMKEVHDKRLIIYGQDYVLITSEYRVVKRIQKSNKVGFWLACSVNDETWEKGELAGRLIHEPFDIPIDSVYKLFRVVGTVSRTESSRVIYAKK